MENKKEDPVVAEVVRKYAHRSELGQRKYGKTLNRDDLDTRQWLGHLQEELMDATLYVEKLLKEIKKYE